MFVSTCWSCLKPTDHDTLDMDCATCPHCGHHECGAAQRQLGRPCVKEVAA